MAQIIDFQSLRHARPQRELLPTGGAEILFFLGVRYERMADDIPVEPRRPSGNARRGRKSRA